eukprot:sb/3462587/
MELHGIISRQGDWDTTTKEHWQRVPMIIQEQGVVSLSSVPCRYCQSISLTQFSRENCGPQCGQSIGLTVQARSCLTRLFFVPLEASSGTPRRVRLQPIRTLYLGHVTAYQPIRGQYFQIWSVPVIYLDKFSKGVVFLVEFIKSVKRVLILREGEFEFGYINRGRKGMVGDVNCEGTSSGTPRRVRLQPIRTLYLGHVTAYQPIRGQYFQIWSVPVIYLDKFSKGVVFLVEFIKSVKRVLILREGEFEFGYINRGRKGMVGDVNCEGTPTWRVIMCPSGTWNTFSSGIKKSKKNYLESSTKTNLHDEPWMERGSGKTYFSDIIKVPMRRNTGIMDSDPELLEQFNYGNRHQNSLFRSRDLLSANQEPVFSNSVGSCLLHIGYQPIRNQYYLIRSVPDLLIKMQLKEATGHATFTASPHLTSHISYHFLTLPYNCGRGARNTPHATKSRSNTANFRYRGKFIMSLNRGFTKSGATKSGSDCILNRPKQVNGKSELVIQPIRDQYFLIRSVLDQLLIGRLVDQHDTSEYNTYYFQQYVLNTRANMYLIRIKYCYCVPPSSKTGPCPTTALPRIATVFPRLLKQVHVPLQLCHELLLSLPRIATVFPRLLKQVHVPLQLCHELLLSATNCYCVPPPSKTGPCSNTALPRIATVFPRLLKQVPVPIQLCHELLLFHTPPSMMEPPRGNVCVSPRNRPTQVNNQSELII